MSEKKVLTWKALSAIHPPAKEEPAQPRPPSETVAPTERVSHDERVPPLETVPPRQMEAHRAERVPPLEPPPHTERASPSETDSASETVSQDERVSTGERVTARLSVAWKDGEFRIPNYIVDNLYPLLDPTQQVVYQRLLRLSLGHNRNWCEVSLPKLKETTGVKQTKLVEALRAIEKVGLIAREKAILGGALNARGNRYLVFLPDVTGAPGERVPLRERVPTGERVPSRERGSQSGSMKKNMKDNHESAPAATAPADVYEVRKIAARVREVHHGQLGYTSERFRADVRTALIGAARDADDETVDEAIKGMAL
jgi:hypothetical protein